MIRESDYGNAGNTVIMTKAERIHIRMDGSHPILNKSFWLYPPASIIGGMVPVDIGVMKAELHAEPRMSNKPTGLQPSALEAMMIIG